MNPNNFQKNPFLNNNASSTPLYKNNKFSNYDKLGRKTVEEVKENMVDVRFKNLKKSSESKKEIPSPKQPNSLPDFKARVNNLKNINRG